MFKEALLILRETYNLHYEYYGGTAHETNEIIMEICKCLSELYNIEGEVYLIEMFDVLQRRYPTYGAENISRLIEDMNSISLWLKQNSWSKEPLELYDFLHKVSSVVCGISNPLTLVMQIGITQRMVTLDKIEAAMNYYRQILCLKPSKPVNVDKGTQKAYIF
jgi:hypothetical protein